MKKVVSTILLMCFMTSSISASFRYQETDPYCSLSGTTHNSLPGEVSDTSSWSIPIAYEGPCDTTPKLEREVQEKIYQLMLKLFEDKWYMWPVYGWQNWYGGSDSLNPEGQIFVKKIFFPAVKMYILRERKKEKPNMKNIAILNTAVKTIGYDYFLRKPSYN